MIGVSIFVIILTVIVFSKTKPDEQAISIGVQGNVLIWSTVPVDPAVIGQIVEVFTKSYGESVSLRYVPVDPAQLYTSLLEAIASGQGPDVLLIPDDQLLRLNNRLTTIPYTTLEQRTFVDAFVPGVSPFVRPEGVLLYPIAVDPLVLYTNSDIFMKYGVLRKPQYWDDYLTLVKTFTTKDRSGKIDQSAIALGEYANIVNAKSIISLLMLQTGSPIVAPLTLRSVILTDENAVAVNSGIRFFMDFSDPRKDTYTWSRSKQDSRTEFLKGTLASYIGFASESSKLKTMNPHMNFTVSLVPQPREVKVPVTLGRYVGFAIVKSSKNQPASQFVVKYLTMGTDAKLLSDSLHMQPVRIDILEKRPIDADGSLFFDAAYQTRTWLDPYPEKTEVLFRNMIESISSAKLTIAQSIAEAESGLKLLLPSTTPADAK